MIIHKRIMSGNLFVYLCNQAICANYDKSRDTFKGVTCKNCLRMKIKGDKIR